MSNLKQYIVNRNGQQYIENSTQVPPDSIIEYQNQIPLEDVPYAVVTDDVDSLGTPIKVISVDDVAKTTALSVQAQDSRNSKLNLLRAKRGELLVLADVEILKHQDSDLDAVATLAEWRTYRIALRGITDTYKDSQGQGLPSLDTFAEDLSDFSWISVPV